MPKPAAGTAAAGFVLYALVFKNGEPAKPPRRQRHSPNAEMGRRRGVAFEGSSTATARRRNEASGPISAPQNESRKSKSQRLNQLLGVEVAAVVEQRGNTCLVSAMFDLADENHMIPLVIPAAVMAFKRGNRPRQHRHARCA